MYVPLDTACAYRMPVGVLVDAVVCLGIGGCACTCSMCLWSTLIAYVRILVGVLVCRSGM